MIQGDVLFLGGVLAGLSGAFTPLRTYSYSLHFTEEEVYTTYATLPTMLLKNLMHSTQLKPFFAFHLLGYPQTDSCK